MRNGKLDKIKEWLKENKLYFIQAGCVIAIAVIVAAIMIPDMAVTHGRLNTAVNRMEQGISHIGSEIADQAKVVQSINADLMAAEEKVDGMVGTVNNHSAAISNLNQKAEALDGAIEEMDEKIDAIDMSAPEAWLTGVAGNFTLHAKASDAGNYTVTITLYYAEPVVLSAGNHTAAMDEFFGALDEPTHAYVPALSFNGDWVVTAISFNVGMFELEADEVKAIAVVYGGLPEDFAPDWAYVAIWPVWKD